MDFSRPPGPSAACPDMSRTFGNPADWWMGTTSPGLRPRVTPGLPCRARGADKRPCGGTGGVDQADRRAPWLLGDSLGIRGRSINGGMVPTLLVTAPYRTALNDARRHFRGVAKHGQPVRPCTAIWPHPTANRPFARDRSGPHRSTPLTQYFRTVYTVIGARWAQGCGEFAPVGAEAIIDSGGDGRGLHCRHRSSRGGNRKGRTTRSGSGSVAVRFIDHAGPRDGRRPSCPDARAFVSS